MPDPEAKRRVMGRIDLANDGYSAMPRVGSTTAKSSPRTITNNRPGSHVRAKVDMSSLMGQIPHMQDASSHAIETTRPRRPLSVASGSSSPFASVASSFDPASASTSRGAHLAPAHTSASSSQSPRILRSPSPVRHLARNPASSTDVPLSSLNGALRIAKDKLPSHARVNSTQVGPSAGVNGNTVVRSSHARSNSSVSPFANESSQARLREGSLGSSSSVITRSRSPSPNTLKLHAAERRTSQSSASSSTVSPNVRSASGPSSLRSPGGGTSRPSLKSHFSSYGPQYSPAEIVSPTSASPSIAATMAKASPFREFDAIPGGDSSSMLHSPQPLLSPSLELDAEALEAKKNRKILDLEITNKSLLAINSGLEVVKLKHVREIRELKKRLRDGRGLGSSLGIDRGMDGERSISDEEDDEDGEEGEEEGALDMELELAHARCKNLIDGMVDQAREAIRYKYEFDGQSKAGNRVLHPAEVEMMHGEEVQAALDIDIPTPYSNSPAIPERVLDDVV